MKLSEAATVLGLNGNLREEFMDKFHPIGDSKFADYGRASSQELLDSLGDHVVSVGGKEFDGYGVDLSADGR